ncbi:hypothetical protein BLNAU_2310 [Blattamonas nauphoetae]|uniref:Protein kinase domain-containing protein n=1 Tax=Blattamonas nauphoetae TaxID=2049346 RepID=A0ABQ9YGI3_9EUKA|nr:hypothetical protein BLNAU_2310 [Blattamonas nauphoetae]
MSQVHTYLPNRIDQTDLSVFRGPKLGRGKSGTVYSANFTQSEQKTSEFEQIQLSPAIFPNARSILPHNLFLKTFHDYRVPDYWMEKAILSHISNACNGIVEFVGYDDSTMTLLLSPQGTLLPQVLSNPETALSKTELIHIMKQTLTALSSLHQAGVVFCDVRPQNLVLVKQEDQPNENASSDQVNTQWKAHLIDFGSSHMIDEDTPDGKTRGAWVSFEGSLGWASNALLEQILRPSTPPVSPPVSPPSSPSSQTSTSISSSSSYSTRVFAHDCFYSPSDDLSAMVKMFYLFFHKEDQEKLDKVRQKLISNTNLTLDEIYNPSCPIPRMLAEEFLNVWKTLTIQEEEWREMFRAAECGDTNKIMSLLDTL